MSLTPDERKWRVVYAVHSEHQDEDAAIVDESFKQVCKVMQVSNYKIAGDDRAEALIAALMKFVVECRDEPDRVAEI